MINARNQPTITQALMQDKERYDEAYRRGYQDGKTENRQLVEDIKAQLQDILQEADKC